MLANVDVVFLIAVAFTVGSVSMVMLNVHGTAATMGLVNAAVRVAVLSVIAVVFSVWSVSAAVLTVVGACCDDALCDWNICCCKVRVG